MWSYSKTSRPHDWLAPALLIQEESGSAKAQAVAFNSGERSTAHVATFSADGQRLVVPNNDATVTSSVFSTEWPEMRR
jgi:hypothetical protein